ncbi:MAG: DUF362 domain-containing protein [Spirochaetes bacterium]|nr:DUF362 domain-containing protein [Spirochaetota bacterium]
MNCGSSRVAVYKATYESIDRTVGDLFSEFRIPLKGRRVLVKPNILSPNPPEKCVTTHPSVVSAVVRHLRAKGADVLVGDNPGVFGYGVSGRAARVSGILEAAQGRFIQLGRRPVRQSLPSGPLGHVMVAGDVLDADIIINLPKLKTHGLTFYTGAIKNCFGYVVGGDKMRVHSLAKTPRRFASALVDIFQIRPPDLTIMDAIDAMEGNGPSNGTVRRLGLVLASDNAVSLDAVALSIIGKSVRSVMHVDMAGKRGLGETDVRMLSIIGKLEPVEGFRMPATFVPGISGIVLNRFLSPWINCVPEIDTARCKRCGICVRYCPSGAMRMGDDHPAADKDTCINCYCCQEMCPEDAIRLSGRMINFIRKGVFYGAR